MQSIFDIKKEESLYTILNCVDTSSPEQIKTEYKQLALLHHPDKSSANTKEFEKIKAAYDIVGDPVNRAVYDRWLSSGLIIPFSEYAQIGTHAQTIHWQALPTQMTLTQHSDTPTMNENLKSVRIPATSHYSASIPIQKNGFWNQKKNYIIQERP